MLDGIILTNASAAHADDAAGGVDRIAERGAPAVYKNFAGFDEGICRAPRRNAALREKLIKPDLLRSRSLVERIRLENHQTLRIIDEDVE
jgi:hypothetical protein